MEGIEVIEDIEGAHHFNETNKVHSSASSLQNPNKALYKCPNSCNKAQITFLLYIILYLFCYSS